MKTCKECAHWVKHPRGDFIGDCFLLAEKSGYIAPDEGPIIFKYPRTYSKATCNYWT